MDAKTATLKKSYDPLWPKRPDSSLTLSENMLVVLCVINIVLGFVLNRITHDQFQPLKMDVKLQQCEMSPLKAIFMYNLMIILIAIFPRVTVDDCKATEKKIGFGPNVAFLLSLSVSST
jgi:hypothetical protein